MVLILIWFLLFLYFISKYFNFISNLFYYFLELKFSTGLRLPFISVYGLTVHCNKAMSQISFQRHREVHVLGWIFFLCWPCFACRTGLCLQTVGG